MNPRRRVLIAICRAIALYTFAAWVYVAAVALVQPQTLPLRLTHLASWPRTDTFGEISFVASFFAFLAYTLLRPQRSASSRNDLRRLNDRPEHDSSNQLDDRSGGSRRLTA